jgi:hypothetical protein
MFKVIAANKTHKKSLHLMGRLKNLNGPRFLCVASVKNIINRPIKGSTLASLFLPPSDFSVIS